MHCSILGYKACLSYVHLIFYALYLQEVVLAVYQVPTSASSQTHILLQDSNDPAKTLAKKGTIVPPFKTRQQITGMIVPLL